MSLTSRSTPHFPLTSPSSKILNHPLPTPLSLFAFSTFFIYAMTGPLCPASITSLAPLVSVCRQVSFTVSPAVMFKMYGLAVVGFGPPLQAMSFEDTSVIG